MTPIIDGLRRLSEDLETTDNQESDQEGTNRLSRLYSSDTTNSETFQNDVDRLKCIEDEIKRDARHYSTDTASTDTFQNENNNAKNIDNDKRRDSRHYLTDSTDTFQNDVDRARKVSKAESNDLASLRNLSTNGLMMFDPLVINAVSASTSNDNRQIPDHDLVTSLNEQVTEIADRLSSIVTSDVDILDQLHSFSTNDVPNLISTDDSEAFGFSGPRNEQLSCMPSTSHGYLIPNAISHEPVVLSSLSHNNSTVFNQEDETHDLSGAILNTDLPLIIPDNIDAGIVNTNISIANANLTSLLLTNEELGQNFIDNEPVDDNTSFHSAKMSLDRDDERVKFMLGYESDHESPVDSGVSTENTSLDRSPDTDQMKDVKENHFMQQNRVLKSPACERDDEKENNTLESSFSDVNNDGTVNINYSEDNTIKNEAGSSNNVVDKVINRLSADEDGLNDASYVDSEERRVLQDWGINTPNAEYRTVEEVLTEIRRHKVLEIKKRLAEEENNSFEGPSQSRESRKKNRKENCKSKRKKGRMWSPRIVILDNRSTQNRSSPLRLNLDHFVDER